MAALSDPQVQTMVELQDPTTVHLADECAARLALLRWPNHAHEKLAVTEGQVEIQERGEKQEESGIIGMLRGISEKLSNLTRGKFAAGGSQQCGLGPPPGQPGYGQDGPGMWVLCSGSRGAHLWGVVSGAGEDNTQWYCGDPLMHRPPARPDRPERRGPSQWISWSG